MRKFIESERVLAGETTREGGVSTGAYASLNLAFHVGDNPLAVKKNREILREQLGAQKLVFMEQIHGTNAREIVESDLNSNLNYTENLVRETGQCREAWGSGAVSHGRKGAALSRCEIQTHNSNLNYIDVPQCDAIFTKIPGVALCVMVADCSPVLIYDRSQNIVAAVHAGRAGVCGEIVSKTLRAMNSRGEDVEIWVGARILGSCYEIGELDLGEFSRFVRDGRFDMSAALRAELAKLGVRRAHFEQICTHCDPRFFSYRRDGVCGRFCGFIMLRD